MNLHDIPKEVVTIRGIIPELKWIYGGTECTGCGEAFPTSYEHHYCVARHFLYADQDDVMYCECWNNACTFRVIPGIGTDRVYHYFEITEDSNDSGFCDECSKGNCSNMGDLN